MPPLKSTVVAWLALCVLVSCERAPAETVSTYQRSSQAVSAGPAKLVKKLNQAPLQPSAVFPASFTPLGNLVIFTSSGIDGRELWRTDGTPAGTFLLRSFWPSVNDPSSTLFVEMNGSLFFSSSDGLGASQLWKTDGTVSGTVLLKDTSPGQSTYIGNNFNSGPTFLTNVSGTLFFQASDGVTGNELWKSDGTATGTVLVKDINPGNAGSNCYGLTNLNGVLLFAASDGTGRWLWRSDGTAAGTVRVKDMPVASPGSLPDDFPLKRVGNTLFFVGSDPVHGLELWKTDGTDSGTVFVKDIYAGSLSSYISMLTDVGGTLFFAANDALHGTELWKSDGTEAGTVLVKDINPGTSGTTLQNFFDVNGTLVLHAATTTMSLGWWRSDGTEAGTTLLTTPSGLSQNSQNFSVTSHSLLFYLKRATATGEIWETDGTLAGTHLIVSTPSTEAITSLLEANGLVYFRAGGMLQIFDRASGQVSTLKAKQSSGQATWAPHRLTDVNGTLFFSAGDDAHGIELWKSDGTEAGTVLVKDINPGPLGTDPSCLINLNGTLIFSAADSTGRYRLWRSDGTDAGTWQLSSSGAADAYAESNTSCVNAIFHDELYFSGNDGMTGAILWKTDGTVAGTRSVQWDHPGITSMVSLDGSLFLTEPVNGNRGLWKSDGTTAGTTLVLEIDTHQMVNANLSILGVASGALYLYADNMGQLWKSDGTAAGTVLVEGNVSNLRPVTQYNPSLRPVTELNGQAYFLKTHRLQLRGVDATGVGTVLIKDFAYTAGDLFYPWYSFASGLMNINGTLYFTSYDPVFGAELWTSDGTEAGTVPLKDIAPDAMSSIPGELYRVGDAIVFRAVDEHGQELWKTGRTAESTVLLQDIREGPALSSPEMFVRSGDKVFFRAQDDDGADELFVIPATEIDTPPQLICPDDLTVDATGGEGTNVAFTAAAADVETMVVPTYSQEPGSFFPIGMHEITVNVVDGLGSTATCSFHITVRSFLTCPADFTVEATSSAGAVVPFEAMTVSAAPITYSAEPGVPLPLGMTTVTAAAATVQGTEATCSFDVRVVDTTPPVIAPLPDIAVEAPTMDGVNVAFSPLVATDSVSLPVVVSTPDSGALFAIGETTVAVVATDAAGNHSEASFKVTVTLKRHSVAAGCGCSSGEAWSGAVLLLGLAALLRRRRW